MVYIVDFFPGQLYYMAVTCVRRGSKIDCNITAGTIYTLHY